MQAWLEVERANAINPAVAESTRQPTLNKITQASLWTIDLPVLLMTGSADLYTPPFLMNELASHFGRAQTAVIDAAGHAAQW